MRLLLIYAEQLYSDTYAIVNLRQKLYNNPCLSDRQHNTIKPLG